MRAFKTFLILAIAALLPAATVQAQVGAEGFGAFPSDSLTDGRFLSAVSGFSGLSEQETTIGLSVPEGQGTFLVRIFDGDTGDPCVLDPATCVAPALGHWDEGTNPIRVRLYEDPSRTGDPSTPLTLVGEWLGNQDNATEEPAGCGAAPLCDWTASPARMPDNAFWDLTVTVSPDAIAPSGTAFYLLEISLAGTTEGVANHKIFANVPLALFSSQFGFEAGLGGAGNDLLILHPTLRDFLDEGGSIFDFDWQTEETTYDGSYSFFLNVDEELETLRIYDGDFDHGGTFGAGCQDTDDPNSSGLPPFVTPGPDVMDEGAVPNGDPQDDNTINSVRRSPCVFYTITDPLGNMYTNDNPSGNQEWEQFVISSDPACPVPTCADVAVSGPLPQGEWRVDVQGLDLSNSNFWRFEQLSCGLVDGAPVCPTERVKIGDTVFSDQNGDGVQNPGEPGINGCKVNLVDTGEMTVTRTIDGVDGMYMFDVDPGTALDPIGYTVEVAPECLGTVATGSVGDRVWFDLDGDAVGGDAGATDAEAGIPNVMVVLRECAGGTPGAALGTTMTDPDGFYTFDNLALGVEYCTEVVVSTLPAGLARTNGSGNVSGSALLTSATSPVLTLDFGYNRADAALAALGDVVWINLDGDDVRDPGEPGIEGAAVELRSYANADCTGTLSVVLATDITDAAGFYYFGELAAGCYKVTVRAGSLPAGLITNYDKDGGTTSPDGMTDQVLMAGDVVLDVDFGYDDDPNDGLQALHCISDYTWYDGDRDGLFDGVNGFPDDLTDIALPGVTVTLRNGLGEAVATATSDVNGFFEFCGLAGDDPTTPDTEVERYVIEITDAAGVLEPFTGTTQAGVDGRQEVLVTDMDVDSVDFGYVDEGLLEQCAFVPSPPLTGTSISGGGFLGFWSSGDEQPMNDLAFDFGCRALYMVGDRVWLNVDGDADGGDFGEESGLGSVTVKLLDGSGAQIDSTTTAPDGFYKFNGVAPGTYTVMVDASTVPAGLVQNFDPDGGTTPPFDGMHTFTLAADLPVNFFKTDVDFGYAEACGLTVEKTCQIVVEPEPFNCSDAKPIDLVSMIWDGGGTVDVTAWKGNVGSTSLGTKTVSDGEEIFFTGFAGSPNDVYWQIKAGGTEIGRSKFHLSCSDNAMNGVEDCGLPQGDGKGNDAGFVNDWRLEGLEGNGQVLDCTPTPASPSQTCEAILGPTPSCEATGDPDFLTWRFSGGGCSASMNSQDPAKTECSESSPGIDPDEPVTVTAGKDSYTVQLGEEFTLKRSDSDEILLTQPGRYEDLKIHTSCSQPLIAGEIFGSLTLAALDGQRAGVTVVYDYLVSNTGPDLFDVTLVDDKLDLGIAPFGLPRDTTKPFAFMAELAETTTNRADVSGGQGAGGVCTAFATATVNVTEPPEPCDECDGGVTELTFKNVGPAAFIEIYDDKDAKANEILFSGFVPQGGEIPLEKRPGERKFDSNISIWIAGQRVALVHTSCSQPIGIGFRYGPLEVVAGRSKNGGIFCDAECSPSELKFEVKDDEVKFKIVNNGATPLQIQRVIAEWPSAKGNLQKIEFDGTIWEGSDAPPAADITAFEGDLKNRALESGDNHELKLRFTKKTTSGRHFVRVEFNNGCFIEADSDAPAGGSFACSKPIDQLTMKWDGGGTVTVTAWKGSVGSTNLGTKTVSQGGEIFFAGFAGSPNDVYWEIFDGGVKRGESKFHLSCSDGEMDGAEDCNTRQGNGKDNNSSLINDWFFEGMIDSDETLDCNP